MGEEWIIHSWIHSYIRLGVHVHLFSGLVFCFPCQLMGMIHALLLSQLDSILWWWRHSLPTRNLDKSSSLLRKQTDTSFWWSSAASSSNFAIGHCQKSWPWIVWVYDFLWPFLWTLCIFWTFRHRSSHFQIIIMTVCLKKVKRGLKTGGEWA